MEVKQNRELNGFHALLLFVLILISIWAAIDPFSRFDWFLENVLVWLTLILFVIFRNQIKLSKTAYVLITLFFALQIYASHYAYQPDIGNWVGTIFDSPRNSFDRVMHFLFGLLLFVPIKECFQNTFKTGNKTAMLCAILAITAFGAVYEIIEWGAMVVLNPQAGAEFVGAQGDIWDAQKDMALALLGSLLTLVAALKLRK